MTPFRVRSDILVKPDEASGKGDRGIAFRAWAADPDAAPAGHDDTPAGWGRVIRAMLKGRHGTPFEGGYLSVYVEAPVVVWWEWTRHRFMSLGCPDLGFSLESGRYRVLEGEFYLPPDGRPVLEPEGFRPLRPVLLSDVEASAVAGLHLAAAYGHAWRHYQQMLAAGVAREAARLALGFGVYYRGYVSANPRTWLQFFSLRRSAPGAAAATFPQWEIEQADLACEALFAERWPIVYGAFNETGRVAP